MTRMTKIMIMRCARNPRGFELVNRAQQEASSPKTVRRKWDSGGFIVYLISITVNCSRGDVKKAGMNMHFKRKHCVHSLRGPELERGRRNGEQPRENDPSDPATEGRAGLVNLAAPRGLPAGADIVSKLE